MILADIGNSFAKFYQNGEISKFSLDKMPKFVGEKVFFINVNPKFNPPQNFIDLSPFVSLDSDYHGMGIDRKVACNYTQNGVIVDGGSAITVDIMQNAKHLGGFIYPGFYTIKDSFVKISSCLDMALNFDINIDEIPQNTADALSYGAIRPIILAIAEISQGKKLYFTGGSGEFLSKFFASSEYESKLVFKSMEKIIKKEKLC